MTEYTILEMIIIMVVAVIVHEVGHILGFLYYGHKPKIGFNWYAITVYSDRVEYLRLKQLRHVLLIGVIFGLPFVIDNFTLLICYLFVSSADIVNILGINEELKKKGNVRVYKVTLIEAEEYKRKYDVKNTMDSTKD